MDSEAIAIIRVRDNGISGGGDEKGSDSRYSVSPYSMNIQFMTFHCKIL